MNYKINQLSNLIQFATDAAAAATTQAEKSRFAGQVEAFTFMREQEIQNATAAIYYGTASQHRDGTPEFARAYNRAAKAQGLPLLTGKGAA